ncbi:MAG TPA: tetratricopeptide repeat protein [Gemmataceae bacterium]|nr:tetratricopeptide repeat protein [Gemmataceae bacterium]
MSGQRSAPKPHDPRGAGFQPAQAGQVGNLPHNGPTNRRKRALLAAGLILLMGLGFVGIRWWRGHLRSLTLPAHPYTPSADPRRAYDGPYRNIHPDVRYVGDAQCAGACHIHDDIIRSYARHPMGRSLVPIEALLDRQRYAADTNNPFRILGRRFEVDRQGKRLWHRQALLDDSGKPPIELAQEVRWAIGSGAKGYAYLEERDGYLFQTPISWFAHQQRWDLSPGFGPPVLTGRLVPAACLFCHANRAPEHPEQPDRFVAPVALQAIGCERCHGPGERHVDSADRWDIVNPARLTPRLRDAVCEQCHLEGEARIVRGGRKLFDYRPGLPLHDFWAVLVQGRRGGEDAKAVNHVEQMYQSKCFARPVGGVKLGCITCHDPHVHVGPAERQTYYRGKCLKCHDEASRERQLPEMRGCSEPLLHRKQISPEDSCIDCHMPRYRSSDIAHTASTDHRIVRRPTRQPIRAADLESAVLVDFYRDRFPGGDPQTERTLGLGLVKMIKTNMLQPQRHADRALRFLESALARDTSDLSVREGKVGAYFLLHRPAEGLSDAELLVREQPDNWEYLFEAAYAAEADGQLDRARDYWRRVVKMNPFVPEYQARLVELLIRAGQMEEARRHCEQLLRLDPFNVSGRQAWVGFLRRQQTR